MPYSYVLTTTIPASPEEIYEAWLDSLSHSEMTGSEARMSDQIGADVSAWAGYISGRNLELVPGKRIVQSWRTSEFAEEHADSIITLVLEEADDGTLLTLEHINVPDEQRSYEESGWQSNYFEPMVAYFSARQQKSAAPAPKKAAAKPVRKGKRAASAKSKRAAARAEATPRKRAGQAKTAAVHRRKARTKSAARKSKRAKRR